MRIPKVILSLTLVALGCAKHESETAVVAAVETIHVQKTASGTGVRYSAAVEPDAQVSVAFRVGGYVDAVRVDEGDRVAKGTILAVVRQSDYREKFGQAAASKAEAEASLTRSKNDLERAKNLFAANALTKPELDSAVASFEMMRSRVDAGRAAAQQADISLRDTLLVAPIAGVILERNIERGDLSSPGMVAFELADTNTVKVTFGVPDMMIQLLHIGDRIDVTTESMPDRIFAGRIAQIAPAADPKSRSFEIELQIANPKSELKPGMVTSLEIARGNNPVLAIPLASVIRAPKTRDQYAVYVVEQQKLRAQVVELGEPMGNLVAVLGGLNGGEEVVISGPALLTEGQAVRVIGGSHAQK